MTRDPRSRAGQSGRTGLVVAVAVGLVVCVLVVVGLMRSQPDFVDQVVIENPTDVRLNVAVKGAPDDAVLKLTSVPPGGTRQVRRVIDQGERWIFVIGWRDVRNEMELSRRELEDQDWTVVVDQEVADAVHREYPPISIESSR